MSTPFTCGDETVVTALNQSLCEVAISMPGFVRRTSEHDADPKDCADRGAFLWAERHLVGFLKRRIAVRLPTSSVRNVVGRREMSALENHAKWIMSLYARIEVRARWLAIAACRRGLLRAHEWRALREYSRSISVPPDVRRLGPIAINRYLSDVEESVEKYYGWGWLWQSACKWQEQCLKWATKLGIQNEYVDQARRDLRELSAARADRAR